MQIKKKLDKEKINCYAKIGIFNEGKVARTNKFLMLQKKKKRRG